MAGLFTVHSDATAIQKPNILWIIAEDLGPELGCYGYPEVATPRLDQLAEDGVRFSSAYTTAPVCSPSRSALMTGMYQTSIGVHNHRSHRDDGFRLPEGVRLLTDRLREVGYFTANIVHLTEDPQERFFRGTGKTDWNFQYDGEPFDTDRWSDLKSHQPFYAQVNFPETHRGNSWNTAHEHVSQKADPAAVTIPPYYPDHPVTRYDWAQYLNSVMALDRKVGFVLDQLRRDGLADNTVVIFFGDNGRAMIRGKQWPYESGLHVPMIVYWPPSLEPPQQYAAGTVDSRLISAIDITATTLAIAGSTPPPLMQGRVFLGSNPSAPRRYVFGGRDRGDETVDRIRTVRDSRFRYIRNFYPERPFLQLNRYKEWTYPVMPLLRQLNERGKLTERQRTLLAPTRPAEELYDLVSDPYETENLAGSTEYRSIREKLSAVLDAWMTETNDRGVVPEPPEIPQFWEEHSRANYEPRLKVMQRLSDSLEVLQISERVWLHVSTAEIEGYGQVAANGILVKAGETSVLIDTPWTDAQTRDLLGWAAETLGSPVSLVVPTHSHEDCLGGLEAAHQAGADSLSLT
ncbi:MAG: sulfatase-like hydrolase/transferase [Acidobacteriota bacterium]|nr:MAG: sulfatase-like hydrolase/transferase [Acidobacteriota bacterium]